MKDSPSRILFDDSFKVKRLCKDLQIISKFHEDEGIYTPVMSISKASEDADSDGEKVSVVDVKTLDDASQSQIPPSILAMMLM